MYWNRSSDAPLADSQNSWVEGSTCRGVAVSLGGGQNLSNSFIEGSFANPRFVRIPSLLAIKPDPAGRNNWTKVSAILWYQSTQRMALDGPRWHSAVLEVGPRHRAPIAPGRSRQCIHQLQLVDPVLCRKP